MCLLGNEKADVHKLHYFEVANYHPHMVVGTVLLFREVSSTIFYNLIEFCNMEKLLMYLSFTSVVGISGLKIVAV